MARNKDLDAILKAFDAIPKAARKPISAALDKGADEMVGRMKYLAPNDPETSGSDLRGNIKKVGISDVAVRVEAIDENDKGEDNALFQEYGSSTRPAQPFFWPSVNTTKKRVRRRVDRAIGKAVKETWGKK